MNGCTTSGMDHVNSRIWDILMSDDMKARITRSVPPLPAQLEYFFCDRLVKDVILWT